MKHRIMWAVATMVTAFGCTHSDRRDDSTSNVSSGPVPDVPSQAALGRLNGYWRIVEYDGAPVDDRGVPGSDPRDTSTFMAGSSVDFGTDRFRLDRGEVTILERRLKVLEVSDRSGLEIDVGYGPGPLVFLGERRARMRVPTVPPHDIVLERD